MELMVPIGELWPQPNPIFDQEFLNDATRIAVTWLEAKLPGLGGNELRTVLNFTSHQQEIAEKQAESARNGKGDQSSDVRALWASVQLVWDKELTEVILNRIVAACDTAVRRRAAGASVSDDRAQYVHGLGYQIL